MFNHVTVLLNEAVEGLNVKPDGIYVDCTLGGAGHSSLILKQLTTGHLYCFDQDIHAIEAARERLEKIGNQFTIIWVFHHLNLMMGLEVLVITMMLD